MAEKGGSFYRIVGRVEGAEVISHRWVDYQQVSCGLCRVWRSGRICSERRKEGHQCNLGLGDGGGGGGGCGGL